MDSTCNAIFYNVMKIKLIKGYLKMKPFKSDKKMDSKCQKIRQSVFFNLSSILT